MNKDKRKIISYERGTNSPSESKKLKYEEDRQNAPTAMKDFNEHIDNYLEKLKRRLEQFEMVAADGYDIGKGGSQHCPKCGMDIADRSYNNQHPSYDSCSGSGFPLGEDEKLHLIAGALVVNHSSGGEYIPMEEVLVPMSHENIVLDERFQEVFALFLKSFFDEIAAEVVELKRVTLFLNDQLTVNQCSELIFLLSDEAICAPFVNTHMARENLPRVIFDKYKAGKLYKLLPNHLRKFVEGTSQNS